MHILVTRPEPFASETIERLWKQGHTVTKAPLFDVTYHPLSCTNNCDALVVTSYQALLVPGIEHLHHLPLWGVGTNEKFKHYGWPSAQAFPDVQKLMENMPVTQRWIYVRGTHITRQLTMPHLVEDIGYTATPVKQWPIDIAWNEIDAVMLMSKETARAFMNLSQPENVRHITALCHSQAICDTISCWPWRHIEFTSTQ